MDLISPYSMLYLAIQERIKVNVPEIRFIEQNLGQAHFENFVDRVSFPCVLIDFPQSKYSGLSGSDQLADVNINLELMFQVFSDTHNLAPEEVRKKGLQYFEIEHKLCNVLRGWNPEFTTPFVRLSDGNRNKNPDSIRVREINFSTEFQESEISEETIKEIAFSFSGSTQ